MTEKEIKNAIIDRTWIGVEDHGILTIDIGFDYGGTHQGLGHYALGSGKEWVSTRLIEELLRTFGARSWEELRGTPVRVQADMTRIYAVAHFMKDNWLVFEEFFQNERERNIPHEPIKTTKADTPEPAEAIVPDSQPDAMAAPKLPKEVPIVQGKPPKPLATPESKGPLRRIANLIRPGRKKADLIAEEQAEVDEPVAPGRQSDKSDTHAR